MCSHGLLLRMTRQGRKKLPEDVECRGKCKRDPCIHANPAGTFPAPWPPDAGEPARPHHAGNTGNRKRLTAIGMPRRHGGTDRIARARPYALPMRRIISIVLMKQHGGAVGDGLANAVIGEVALRTFRESAPTLSPLFGAIFPLTETCSRDFR